MTDNGKVGLYHEKFRALEKQGVNLSELLAKMRTHIAEQRVILSNFDDEADALERHLALRPRPVNADAEA